MLQLGTARLTAPVRLWTPGWPARGGAWTRGKAAIEGMTRRGRHFLFLQLRDENSATSTRPDLSLAVSVEERFQPVFTGNPAISQILPPTWQGVRKFNPALCVNLHGGPRSLDVLDDGVKLHEIRARASSV